MDGYDETGRFKQKSDYYPDAVPSASNKPSETKSLFPEMPPPSKEKVEDPLLATIDILYKTLKDEVFRFKEPEEKSLLKRLCDYFNQENPHMEIQIGDVIDMYYELDEGSSISEVISQFHKRREAKKQAAAETEEMEVAVSAPATSNANAKKDKKMKDLKPELLCKVCLDSQVAVTFVPCGHLVTCVSCTAALFECPVCRAHIRGTIRTYI